MDEPQRAASQLVSYERLTKGNVSIMIWLFLFSLKNELTNDMKKTNHLTLTSLIPYYSHSTQIVRTNLLNRVNVNSSTNVNAQYWNKNIINRLRIKRPWYLKTFHLSIYEIKYQFFILIFPLTFWFISYFRLVFSFFRNRIVHHSPSDLPPGSAHLVYRQLSRVDYCPQTAAILRNVGDLITKLKWNSGHNVSIWRKEIDPSWISRLLRVSQSQESR